ncbi:hypothetical protein ACIQJX_04985 [Streptomyces griseoviridis]
MNTRSNPDPGALQDLGWVAGPAAGLGHACARCRPTTWNREPDSRRWLESTPRHDTAQLAASCALAGYERHTATVLRTAEITRQARRRAQQLFPYGLGPVLGDLMLPTDGGGDMLHALTDVAQSMFARRRPPRLFLVCPWGSTDSAGCGRDPFGRLLHDHCRTPDDPVPAWRSKSWAVWSWRTAQELNRLPPQLMQHHPQPAEEGLPRRIGAGMIGPITVLIGRDGPAHRARHSRSALYTLVQRLGPTHLKPTTVLGMLHRHLGFTIVGPHAYGWRGYAPRSLFTAALQARHASVHQGPDDVLVEHLARYIGRRTEGTVQGLLQDGWDDQVLGNDDLQARLRAAVRAASLADTELWERTRQGVHVMDNPDILADGKEPTRDTSDQEEAVSRVLAKLTAAERAIAECYAADGLTWKQAALKAAQPASMGERVRRKLKRLGAEYPRRRRSDERL